MTAGNLEVPSWNHGASFSNTGVDVSAMKMISMISMNLSGFGAILENLELRIVICAFREARDGLRIQALDV